jgi:Flp pilus assembly protein TadG
MRLHPRLRKLAKEEEGFSLVFVGLGFMAFLAVSMLAIDVGMLMTARAQAQNSADAAALAGATALAFDNWDDRSATGPAVTYAIAGGQQNQVMSANVAIGPADVTFPNDPVTGDPSRVHAIVYRDAAHGNPVSTLIAKYFGISTADIVAAATAEAAAANAMTCVKPFTIPDKWIEHQTAPWDSTDTFDRYKKQGSNMLVSALGYDRYVRSLQETGQHHAGDPERRRLRADVPVRRQDPEPELRGVQHRGEPRDAARAALQHGDQHPAELLLLAGDDRRHRR